MWRGYLRLPKHDGHFEIIAYPPIWRESKEVAFEDANEMLVEIIKEARAKNA